MSPVAQMVLDNMGLLGGMKQNRGAMAFFTAKEQPKGFTPKFLPTEVVHRSIVLMKKKPRPVAQKLFDYLKSNLAEH
jgi:hypothetical protein